MMDTKAVYMATVAIAVGALMWQLGGFAAAFDNVGPGEELESGDEFEEDANSSAVRNETGGDVNKESDNLVGLALSGIGAFFGLLELVVFLPFELSRLGLPWFAAWPLGLFGWTVTSIGLLQIASGKVFQ